MTEAERLTMKCGTGCGAKAKVVADVARAVRRAGGSWICGQCRPTYEPGEGWALIGEEAGRE